MSASTPHERMITSMATLFDQMDAATIAAWGPLTGLQIQLMRVVAAHGRVDRGSLALWALTSRAATVPSLGSLLQRGLLAEEVDAEGPRLVIAPGGRRLLAGVRAARTAWLRDLAEETDPPVDDAELVRAVALLDRLTAASVLPGRVPGTGGGTAPETIAGRPPATDPMPADTGRG